MDLIQRLIDKFGYTEAFWEHIITKYYGGSFVDAEEIMDTDPDVIVGFAKKYKIETGIDPQSGVGSGGGGGMTFEELPQPEQFPRGYVPAFDYSSDSYYWKYVGEVGEAPLEPNVNEPYYWTGASWQTNPFFVTDAERVAEAQRRLDAERNYAMSQQELVNRMSQSAQGLEQQRLATAQSQLQAMAAEARTPRLATAAQPESTPFNWINQWKWQHRQPTQSVTQRTGFGANVLTDTGTSSPWGIAGNAAEAQAMGLDRWTTNAQAQNVLQKWGLTDKGWTIQNGQITPPKRTLYESATGERVDVPPDVLWNIEASGAVAELANMAQGSPGGPFNMERTAADRAYTAGMQPGSSLSRWAQRNPVSEGEASVGQWGSTAGMQGAFADILNEAGPTGWGIASFTGSPYGPHGEAITSGFIADLQRRASGTGTDAGYADALLRQAESAAQMYTEPSISDLSRAYGAAGPKVPTWATGVIPGGARITPGSRLAQSPGGKNLATRFSLKRLGKTGVRAPSRQLWNSWLPSERQGFGGLASAAYGPVAEDYWDKVQRSWTSSRPGRQASRRMVTL